MTLQKTIPTPIPLDPEDAKKLKKLGEQSTALQKFIQLMTETGQQRLQTFQAEQTKVWKEIEQKYGIDINNVIWKPSDDGNFLVPIQMNIQQK